MSPLGINNDQCFHKIPGLSRKHYFSGKYGDFPMNKLAMRKCGINFDGPNNHHRFNGGPPKVPLGMENDSNFLKIPDLSL